MAFAGFPTGGQAWFDALAENMGRDWYDENKAVYRTLWHDPMVELLTELRERLRAHYEAPLASPRVHRIHNDQRFHAREPYKTHIGGWLGFTPRGEGMMSGAVALHVSFGREEHTGAGVPVFDKDAMRRWREAVVDDRSGGELTDLLAEASARGLRHHAFAELKKGPPGLQDHPRVGLLKRKGLLVTTDAPPEARRHGPELVDDLEAIGAAVAPVVGWLQRHVVG